MTSSSIIIKMVNKETGYYYTTKKNKALKKLTAKKYDPTIRKHALFTEEKKLK